MRAAPPILILCILPIAAFPLTAQQQQDEIRKGKSALEINQMADTFWARQRNQTRIPPLRNQVLKDAIRDLKAGDSPRFAALYVSYAEFITPSGEYFVPIQLMVRRGKPFEAGEQVTLFGTIDDLDGHELYSFEDRIALEPSGNDVIASRSLFLRPGLYLGTVGLARENTPLALERVELSLLEVPKKEPGVSRLLLSSDIHPLEAPQPPTEPFAFGGIKVVPRGDHLFEKNDGLWAFFELRNPGLNKDGLPAVQLIVELEGPAGPQSRQREYPPTPADAVPLKGVAGHWGVGTNLDTRSLASGDYMLHILLTDTIRSLQYHLVDSFRIASGGP